MTGGGRCALSHLACKTRKHPVPSRKDGKGEYFHIYRGAESDSSVNVLLKSIRLDLHNPQLQTQSDRVAYLMRILIQVPFTKLFSRIQEDGSDRGFRTATSTFQLMVDYSEKAQLSRPSVELYSMFNNQNQNQL